MADLKINDFGEASFKYEKKGFKGGITAHGTIKDIDGKYILFVDTEDFPYLVRKDKFNLQEEVLRMIIFLLPKPCVTIRFQ
jgi:glutamate racemase